LIPLLCCWLKKENEEADAEESRMTQSPEKSHTGQPEIICELNMGNCPADIIQDDLGKECVRWLSAEYPECSVSYDHDFFKVLLLSGHNLNEERIQFMRGITWAFVAGLKYGVNLARQARWPGSFQYSGMALLRHPDHYEIAEMRKVIDDIKRVEGKELPYNWRELFGDETPREFRFNREDTDEFGERNNRVLLDDPPAPPQGD
jgi:hypothetical protein